MVADDATNHYFLQARHEILGDLTARNLRPLFVQLEPGSEEQQYLDKATKDLFEKLTDVPFVAKFSGSNESYEGPIQALSLMLLDIAYVETMKLGRYSLDNANIFECDGSKMLKYLKMLVESGAPIMQQSCMAVLLVKMAISSMSLRLHGGAGGWKLYQLYHHLAWEACPEVASHLLRGTVEDYTSDWDIKKADDIPELQYHVGFTGFQCKPPSSMINKMYCRRGKVNRNIVGDRVRSRLAFESAEDVQRLYENLKSKSYFHHVSKDGADARKVWDAHAELMSMVFNKEDGWEKWIFGNKKKVPYYDCGDWSHTNLIIQRVKWNAACGKGAVDKDTLFNVNYYINCPGVHQSLDGFTLTVCEMQVGTKSALETLDRIHKIYDRQRVVSCNKSLQVLDECLTKLTPDGFEGVSYTNEELDAFTQHYRQFQSLTVVIDENRIHRVHKAFQRQPVRTVAWGDKSDRETKNYTGRYGNGAGSRLGIVWEHRNNGSQGILQTIKAAKLWASDQGWGSEGHSSCALAAFIGDFFYELVPQKTVKHSPQEFIFVENYQFTPANSSSSVVLGDLEMYDSIALCIRTQPWNGHQAKAYGYEVEYTLA